MTVTPDLAAQHQRQHQRTHVAHKANDRNTEHNRLDARVVHNRRADKQAGDHNCHRHAVDNSTQLSQRLIAAHDLRVHLKLAAREHARRQAQILGRLERAFCRAIAARGKIVPHFADARIGALLVFDVRLDDLDHVDVGHILGQQTLECHHATREHRHHARQFNVVFARQI